MSTTDNTYRLVMLFLTGEQYEDKDDVTPQLSTVSESVPESEACDFERPRSLPEMWLRGTYMSKLWRDGE